MWWIIGIIVVIALIKWLSYKDDKEIRRKVARNYIDEARAEIAAENDENDEDEDSDEIGLPVYDSEHRDISIMLILICLDKRDEVDDRLAAGCFNSLEKFFVNDANSFSPTIDRIREEIELVDIEKLLKKADLILTEEEKQYCYNVCSDIYDYDSGYGNNKEMLDFIINMSIEFNLDLNADEERRKGFEIQDNVEFKPYKNSKANFSLNAPLNWIIQEDLNNLIKVVIKRNNLNTIDIFAENINVAIENAQHLDLSGYINASKTLFVKSFQDFNILEEGDFNFKNGLGYYMAYSFESEDVGSRSNVCYVLLNKNIAYLVTGGALDSTASSYRQIFDESAKSFALEN